MEKVISFPHMGNYNVPVQCLLNLIFDDCKIQEAPTITKKTLELGSRYSPDFVCVPFKYNLGNFIEALENGANILLQAGGGCRFGYYGEVQEQILRDLGYDFEFIQFLNADVNIFSIYKVSRRLGSKLSMRQFLNYILLIFKMVSIIDDVEGYIRENIGFESIKGSFDKLHREFLKELKQVDSWRSLDSIHKNYDRQIRELMVNKPNNCLKVGMVGELYTLMEPYSNFFMEKELAKNNMVISRYITATYLLFQKSRQNKTRIKQAGGYLKYHLGADGTDSVARSRMMAESGYDGIIHVKPFGCTPEVNAMPMLQNIGRDYKIPILYFSFDSQTSETGIKTRIEAFNDMILMRKGLKG